MVVFTSGIIDTSPPVGPRCPVLVTGCVGADRAPQPPVASSARRRGRLPGSSWSGGWRHTVGVLRNQTPVVVAGLVVVTASSWSRSRGEGVWVVRSGRGRWGAGCSEPATFWWLATRPGGACTEVCVLVGVGLLFEIWIVDASIK
jgi:hypothetical protein